MATYKVCQLDSTPVEVLITNDFARM